MWLPARAGCLKAETSCLVEAAGGSFPARQHVQRPTGPAAPPGGGPCVAEDGGRLGSGRRWALAQSWWGVLQSLSAHCCPVSPGAPVTPSFMEELETGGFEHLVPREGAAAGPLPPCCLLPAPPSCVCRGAVSTKTTAYRHPGGVKRGVRVRL